MHLDSWIDGEKRETHGGGSSPIKCWVSSSLSLRGFQLSDQVRRAGSGKKKKKKRNHQARSATPSKKLQKLPSAAEKGVVFGRKNTIGGGEKNQPEACKAIFLELPLLQEYIRGKLGAG